MTRKPGELPAKPALRRLSYAWRRPSVCGLDDKRALLVCARLLFACRPHLPALEGCRSKWATIILSG
jgi:hypothetical protein